jgi:hypothetical protein
MPPGLASKPLIPRPLEPLESETLVTELDTLSVFPPESSSSTFARAAGRATENPRAGSRYIPAVDHQDTRAASQTDTKRLDDFRKLLRQTQLAVEQLKGDASALRGDLSELRSLGDHLGQGYTRLAEICRLTEKRSEVTADVLNAIEKRIKPLEAVRDLSATTEDSFASLKQLAEEVMQCAARFEAQEKAIDQAREEATRVARKMEALNARVTRLTQNSEWLGQAEETVGRLEYRAIETTSLLERRVSDFDTQKGTIEQALVESLTESDRGLERAVATVGQLEQRAATTAAQLDRRITDCDTQKQTIERAVAEATHVTAILSALEQRVAMLAGDRDGLKQAEATVGQLERRTAEARIRIEQVLTDKHGVERELERVEKQLQTLTESARESVKLLRSTDPSRSPAWSLRRPLLRWATILAAFIVLGLLGIFMLRRQDQSVQTARTTPVAHQSLAAAAVSPLLRKEAPLAMFVMPAGSLGASTITRAASELPPTNRRGPARATRTPPTVGVSRVGESANQTVQPYVGVLTVDSEPTGSAVFVDQQHVGETPLKLTRLRAGSHVVRIEREGYDRWTAAVLVAADKQTSVSAKLQALRDR